MSTVITHDQKLATTLRQEENRTMFNSLMRGRRKGQTHLAFFGERGEALLCGDIRDFREANIVGIAEFLSKRLKVEVEISTYGSNDPSFILRHKHLFGSEVYISPKLSGRVTKTARHLLTSYARKRPSHQQQPSHRRAA